MNEVYFAIQVGDGPDGYFWCGEDGVTPNLYITEDEAAEDMDGFDDGQARVVPVLLSAN